MKKLFTTLLFFITICALAQERVNATLPEISAIAKGRITEATGWMQNDAGEWLSRKNRMPSNFSGRDKALIDHEHYTLGEFGENFIYIELRDVKIKDSTYTILIKKFKDGDYKYPTIQKGWTPYNSLIYYVFSTSELEKLKNLDPNKTHAIQINTIYSNTISHLSPSSSINTIAQNLNKFIKDDDTVGMQTLIIYTKQYKDKVRFIVRSYERTLEPDPERSYYETTKQNFDNFIKL